MEGESSKARGSRPCREWEQDPLCFAHVRLLAFDLLALRPVPHMPGSLHKSFVCFFLPYRNLYAET